MDEQTKRKMIHTYFGPFPSWVLWAIIIGVAVLFIPMGGSTLLGIVIAGIGGYGIYSYSQGKPTDEQMDKWLEEDLKSLSKKALNKMGIDNSQLVSEPVQVTGPYLWDIGGVDVFFKKGKDHVLRFTPIGVSIINFSENELLGYTCVFDFASGKALNESTDEYFYKDVVSVTTKCESKLVNSPKLGTLQLNAAETFTLTTSGGTSLTVLLRDPALIEKMGGGEIPITRAEKAIQAVRKMLREKKA